MHNPIQLKEINLYFPDKTCFDNFSVNIHARERIGIIGRNGSGKSSLLKIISREIAPTSGQVIVSDAVKIGSVPQIITEFDSLSGGQKFNQKLIEALSEHPDVLLLDEPTNHLDFKHRRSLFKLLKHYTGTLVVVSHDIELLETQVDKLWHIDQGRVIEFKGNYLDYQQKRKSERQALEQEKNDLSSQKKQLHEKRMKEQIRASNSSAKGKKSIQNRKWPTIVSRAKASRANNTAGRKVAELNYKRVTINEKLSGLPQKEIIKPTFGLSSGFNNGHSNVLEIRDGSVGYGSNIVLRDLSICLSSNEKLAICGENGCGKTTLLKAILRYSSVTVTGEWFMPKIDEIGYLDQNYHILEKEKTVLETIETVVPQWDHNEIRKHLNTYLFRKNEEVNLKTKYLSGGEKARLCLAKIAARPPKLLILDEVTNNLDIETKEHVTEVLVEYPGAMIVVSHDEGFLNALGLDRKMSI